MGGTVDGGIKVTTYQGTSDVTMTRSAHTLRGGVDIQWAQRRNRDGAGNMTTLTYDNQYTRAADTTNTFPAGNLGLSLAAFMLGMPSRSPSPTSRASTSATTTSAASFRTAGA